MLSLERWYYGWRLRHGLRELRWEWEHSWENGWHETNLCKWWVHNTIVYIEWL
jgi:hypothetical protein